MRDFEAWLRQYRAAVEEVFGERIVCIGLQGSRGRGEAGTASDIDMVLVLDDVSTEDLLSYRVAVESLPERELLCGFVSGRVELEHWNPGELFQFYHDTGPSPGIWSSCAPWQGRKPRRWRSGTVPAPCITAAPTICSTAGAGRRWESSIRPRALLCGPSIL